LFIFVKSKYIKMNKGITTLFFLIKKDKVLICESNLKDLFNQLPKELEGIRTYDYYYRNFKKSSYFQFEFNREYYFQKIEYNRE